MVLVAIPLLALAVRDGVNRGLAVGAAGTAAYLPGIPVSLWFGLGRRRFDPRMVLAVDAVLRAALFSTIGVLGIAGHLSLWGLVALLAASSGLRTLASGARRLVAADLAGPERRMAAHALISSQLAIATWTLGPALGGILTAVLGPSAVVLIDGVSFLPLLIVVLRLPRGAGITEEEREVARSGARASSGLDALRRRPDVAGLLLLTFLFNLFYGPVDVALPIHVESSLPGGAAALGAIWAGFGVGAVVGSVLSGLLGRFPRIPVVIGIVAGWAVALEIAAEARSVWLAVAAFTLGGLIFAPFLPIVYTSVQDTVAAAEYQAVLTVWSAVSIAAAPLGTAIGGPVVAGIGAVGTLRASAAITMVLAAVAAVTAWSSSSRRANAPIKPLASTAPRRPG